MKIISFLNVSNLERISADSGYIFQKLLVPQLIAAGHSFVFVSPSSIAGCQNPLFKHIPFSFGCHKFEVRFNFPWKDIERILEEESPDVVWVHQPELATSFRALLNSIGSKAHVVTYLHYFPYDFVSELDILRPDPAVSIEGSNVAVVLQFLNGVLACDTVLVHSRYAQRILQKALEQYRLSINTRIEIIPPPLDPELLPSQQLCFSQRDCIMYNHRLYAQYGTELLIETLKLGLRLHGHHFLIMDILGTRNAQRRRLDVSVERYREILTQLPGVRVDGNGNDRLYYARMLDRSKIGLAPFRPNCTWSMSVIDCLAAGIPVLAPRYGFFPEIIPSQCLFDGSFSQLQELIDTFIFDQKFWQACSMQGKRAVEHLAPHLIASQLIQVLTQGAVKQDPLPVSSMLN